VPKRRGIVTDPVFEANVKPVFSAAPEEGGGQAERFAIAGERQTTYDEACCENAIFLNRQGFIG
tara:strand:+ start:232 stop:423 length:192 start_codon:yes stop_codon:yes gene_type:complete